MSTNSREYQALKRTAILLPNPEGLVNFEAPSTQDKMMIRQNNTIIELLIQLNEKLTRLIAISPITPTIPSIPDYKAELEAITVQLGNMTLPKEPGKQTMPVVQYQFGTPRI